MFVFVGILDNVESRALVLKYWSALTDDFEICSRPHLF